MGQTTSTIQTSDRSRRSVSGRRGRRGRIRRTGRAALALALLALGPMAATASSAPWNIGDVFVGIGDGKYNVYDNSGTFKETIDQGNHARFTTGCAFDITYRYMAADEQQFLMDRVAQLERDGKVEALKERRNHIHVFVFPDGQRPPEELVAQFLDEVDASHGIVRDGSGAIVRAPGRRGARGVRAR